MASDSKKSPQQDWSLSPFALMRQGVDEMDRWFSRLVGDRGGAMPWASGRGGRAWPSPSGGERSDWSPAIEAFQRGSEFVVRAEVPGLKRNELTVEAGDDSLTIRGERRQEQTEEREGMFWTERSYGSFCRVIPLPPGTSADSAKASFNNGVLEVVMQAPPQESRRGRKIDISGGGDQQEKKQV
jgi:HSP20 family protein